MELATAATAAIAGTAALLGRQLQSNAASSQELSLARLDLTRLKKRLVNEDGLGTKERAIAALAEYKRFLQVVRLHPEESLQPCAAVDAVWQRHLLDTKEYAADCGAMFGAYGHRLYPKRPEAKATAALGRTRELYQQTHGVAPPADMWSELPMAPALISISSSLPRMPSRSLPARVWRPQGARDGAVENEDLEWLGTAVAKELPLKQSKCKHAEPLREIAMADPAATVVEYKKFLRMMVDDSGAWFTPSKLVDELWHRHMLDTVAYGSFCQRVAGDYLHHTPHYGEPHSYHDPGYMATLKTYEAKFGHAVPNGIWGTVGESGGGGCGGGGGSDCSSDGVGGGNPIAFIICFPCFCMIFVAAFVYGGISVAMTESCNDSMQAEATACNSISDTPSGSGIGQWQQAGLQGSGNTPLGKCFDRTIKVVKKEYTKGCNYTQGCNTARNITWKSFNSRTGQGKSCEDYQSQRLCNICERVSSQGNQEGVGSSLPTGGSGWQYEWGSPGDQQYANGGLTAVDACCACGGGSSPLITKTKCYAASKSCDEISDCATTKTNVVMVVLVLAMLVCAGFSIKKALAMREEQKKEAEEKAKQAEEAVAAAGTVTVAVVNPAAGAGVAQTQMMQVAVPPGVSAGQTIMIATPAGQQLQVAVPAGVGPGQSFQVAVPAPAVATAVAVAVAAQPVVVAAQPVVTVVAAK